MGLGDRITLFAATGCGLGRIPFAPGTFGSLAGLPLIWILSLCADHFGPGIEAFLLVCLVLVAVWVSDRAETIMGLKDPGSIVIDEVAGYCVTMCLVPVTCATLLAGFIAFRCFDIVKPPPVRYFERSFSGGAGVVLDDIMAGVLAAFLLKIIALTGLI